MNVRDDTHLSPAILPYHTPSYEVGILDTFPVPYRSLPLRRLYCWISHLCHASLGSRRLKPSEAITLNGMRVGTRPSLEAPAFSEELAEHWRRALAVVTTTSLGLDGLKRRDIFCIVAEFALLAVHAVSTFGKISTSSALYSRGSDAGFVGLWLTSSECCDVLGVVGESASMPVDALVLCEELASRG